MARLAVKKKHTFNVLYMQKCSVHLNISQMPSIIPITSYKKSHPSVFEYVCLCM